MTSLIWEHIIDNAMHNSLAFLNLKQGYLRMFADRRFHKLSIKTSNPILIQKLLAFDLQVKSNEALPLISSFLLDADGVALKRDYSLGHTHASLNTWLKCNPQDIMISKDMIRRTCLENNKLLMDIQFSSDDTPKELFLFLYFAYNPLNTPTKADSNWDDDIEGIDTRICVLWVNAIGDCSYWMDGEEAHAVPRNIHYDRYDTFAQDIKAEFRDYYDIDIQNVLEDDDGYDCPEDCNCIANIGRVEDESTAVYPESELLLDLFAHIEKTLEVKNILKADSYGFLAPNKLFFDYKESNANPISFFALCCVNAQTSEIEIALKSGYKGNFYISFPNNTSLNVIAEKMEIEAHNFLEFMKQD